jgi:hypothetical protein
MKHAPQKPPMKADCTTPEATSIMIDKSQHTLGAGEEFANLLHAESLLEAVPEFRAQPVAP